MGDLPTGFKTERGCKTMHARRRWLKKPKNQNVFFNFQWNKKTKIPSELGGFSFVEFSVMLSTSACLDWCITSCKTINYKKHHDDFVVVLSWHKNECIMGLHCLLCKFIIVTYNFNQLFKNVTSSRTDKNVSLALLITSSFHLTRAPCNWKQEGCRNCFSVTLASVWCQC